MPPCQSAAVPAASPLVIAVDGPAASGKGTIARALATHYGLPHMDTGLLYRAVALSLLRWGGDPSSEFEAVRACRSGHIPQGDPDLRSEIVGEIASRISAFPAVRAELLDRQREFAAGADGAVLDGRDTGTVIAPGASAKLFVTASPEIRAGRRTAELVAQGRNVHFDEVLTDIRARDERDQRRDDAPLARADDALLLDTGGLDIDAAIAAAIALIEARLAAR